MHRIYQNEYACESRGIQQLDALESLLVYLIEKFGPLTSTKLFELVCCFGSHGIVNSSSCIEKIVAGSLQNLMLEKHTILYSPEYGIWKLNRDHGTSSVNSTGVLDVFPRLTLRNFSKSEKSINVKGVGSEYVYVVYQSEARIESILRNRKNWPLKVGRTNNLQRRVAQLSESGPNSLVIGIAYKSHDAKGLEKFIHKALHDQKQACEIPGRREWFYSNLDEISDLRRQFERKSFLAA